MSRFSRKRLGIAVVLLLLVALISTVAFAKDKGSYKVVVLDTSKMSMTEIAGQINGPTEDGSKLDQMAAGPDRMLYLVFKK